MTGMHLHTSQKILMGYMAFLIIFWLALFLSHSKSGSYNYLYSFFMSVLPLVGGFFAMEHSRDWKDTHGFVSKGVFFLGLGIFCWGFGGMIWAYYNFFAGVAAPYPSFADIGYAPSVFFYSIGAVYLARGAGADFGLKRKYAKIFIFLAPVIMCAISYYLLVIVARQGNLVTFSDPLLKVFLDIAYPLGDFLSLTLAVVISGLSFKFLIGQYKLAIYSVLSGLGVIFAADMIFSYTTTRGSYFNGDFGDLLFGIALFLLTFGALGFCTNNAEEKDHNLHVFKFLWYN